MAQILHREHCAQRLSSTASSTSTQLAGTDGGVSVKTRPLQTATTRRATRGAQRSTMEEHVLQALSPRGAWQHVMARLSLRDELEEEVRVEVASLEGFEDEVIVDLVCRHCARAIQEQKFDVEELGWLLGLLLGGDRAASLVLCVVEFLDVGLATSWYDDDLRRRSLGVRRSRRR